MRQADGLHHVLYGECAFRSGLLRVDDPASVRRRREDCGRVSNRHTLKMAGYVRYGNSENMDAIRNRSLPFYESLPGPGLAPVGRPKVVQGIDGTFPRGSGDDLQSQVDVVAGKRHCASAVAAEMRWRFRVVYIIEVEIA